MIDLLVDRLRWPAALVRERAAAQIAKLIADGRQDVRDALLAWVGRQELESRVATGIVPFLRAEALTNVQPVAPQDLDAACGAKSVLSDLLMSHYDPSYPVVKTSMRHSGLPPTGWRPPDAHRETTARGLEASLFQRLRIKNFQSSLTRQFEFEVATLRRLHGEPTPRVSNVAGTRQEGYHPAWYTLSDEIGISAYLRTLAWAETNCGIPRELVHHLAAFVAPVDLGLWQVTSAARPEWWPNLDTEQITSSIEAQIAAAIQNTSDSASEWGSGPNIVLAASGCIFQSGLAQHDLEVRAFFQQADGPLRPSTEDVFDALHLSRTWVDQQASPLRFEGPVSSDNRLGQIGDWSILPCSGTAHPTAMMSWQAWRGMRAVQCPSDALSDREIHAVCSQYSVDYKSEEGLIATWSDWSAGLSATSIMGLTPATGWVLTTPRNVIENFSRKVGMRLCWAWEVRSHFRDRPHEEFKRYRSCGERGTSSLAIP